MKSRLVFGAALTLLGGAAHAQNPDPDSVYKDLRTSTSWVHPQFNGKLDLSRVNETARGMKPYEMRLLAVPQLGSKWVKNGSEMRTAFAKYVTDTKLPFGDKGVLVVLTRKGISGYNSKLTESEIVALNTQAAKLVTPTDFTSAVVSLGESIQKAAAAKPEAKTTTAPMVPEIAPPVKETSPLSSFLCIAIPLGLIGLVVLAIKGAAKQKIAASKRAAEERKTNAVQALAYVDSYDGLYSEGRDAEALKQYRTRMGESFDEGLTKLRTAKTVEEYDQANYTFQQVVTDFESSKEHLNVLTGGSGVAYTIPPIVNESRAPIFQPVEGASYFSSEPSQELVPIEVNFGGTRKTVMVTPSERDELIDGRMPQMRGQYDQRGHFVPWYQVQGYDPHRDYGSRNFMWDFMAMSALSNMLMPHHGYGWGGGLFGGHNVHYGGDTYIINDTTSNSSSSFGGSSGDFGFGGSSGDFGGSSGDFGGSSGDFGGSSGDFGGGGDSGGGGGGDF